MLYYWDQDRMILIKKKKKLRGEERRSTSVANWFLTNMPH